ncbi:MAG: hypothetical protein IJ757_09375 [Clostridiales bacterium]|nr:hypothetical protein [Clostridiales bacterium]
MAYRRLSRLTVTAGAAVLASAMLLSSCSTDRRSSRSGRHRDDDEDEETSIETEETADETEETETVPEGPSSSQVAAAYLQVLNQYSHDIRTMEDRYAEYMDSIAGINYTDINGDGIEELIIRYCSDAYQTDIDTSYFVDPTFANVAIFTYSEEAGRAVKIFDVLSESSVGAWDLSGDLVMMDDGTILLTNMNGRMGYYTQSIAEYVYDGSTYVAGDNWMVSEYIPEDQYTSYTDAYAPEADYGYHNDTEITPEEFYSTQEDYLSRVVCPIMPYSGRQYNGDLNTYDLFDRPWCGMEGAVFATGNYISFDEVYEQLANEAGADVVSQLEATAEGAGNAYLEILNQYYPYLRMVETAEYSGMPSCSYVDITGDLMPELLIQYASDFEDGYETDGSYFMTGDIRIFTYDQVSGQAVEMLHVENTILNAGGGSNSDVVVLNNGNILLTHGWGDEDSEYWVDEYEVRSNSLMLVNSLYHGEFLQGEGDNYYYESDYSLNDRTITEDEYNSQISTYRSTFSSALARDPFYIYDWYGDSEWVTDVMNVPYNAIHADDLTDLLSN